LQRQFICRYDTYTAQEHGSLIWFFLFFWASSNHCLAALDLGADVEQPFDCLIARTVRPCSPWEGRWIGHWKTTWSTIGSFAPHSQATEEVILHLCKQERKRPTPVRRRLSQTQTFLGRVTRGVGCRCRGWKCGVLWGCPPTSHSIGDPPNEPHVCCCCQMNWELSCGGYKWVSRSLCCRAVMRLQFTHVLSFACRGRLRNLRTEWPLQNMVYFWSLLRDNNMTRNLQTITSSYCSKRLSASDC